MEVSEFRKILQDNTNNIKYVPYKEGQLNINMIPMYKNLREECYRELLVSYMPMIDLLSKPNVRMDEADYILYMHAFARLDDCTEIVYEQILSILEIKKPSAKVIVMGKATNIEKYLEEYKGDIIYLKEHFTENLGKKFNENIREQYVVYDDQYQRLNIWPVDGCNKQCSFCRRTYMHIPFNSQSIEFLKEKLDWYKENHPEQMKYVSLRAENLTEYGIDIYGYQALDKLLELIESYDEIEVLELPFGMCIGEINEDILNVLLKSKKLKAICLNLEAGSNRLLKLINKGHTKEQALRIFKLLRENNPNIYVYSNAIIGLPTETMEDIYELAQLICECEADYYYFPYYTHSKRNLLDKYEQLSPSLKRYHLDTLLRTLSKSDIKHQFIVRAPAFLRKRSEIIADIKRLERQYRYDIDIPGEIQNYYLFCGKESKKRVLKYKV